MYFYVTIVSQTLGYYHEINRRLGRFGPTLKKGL